MLAAGRVLPGVTVSLAQELISVQFTQAGVQVFAQRARSSFQLLLFFAGVGVLYFLGGEAS